MNYDLLPKSFIVLALVVIAGSFGTGVYFSQKTTESTIAIIIEKPQVASAVTAVERTQIIPTSVPTALFEDTTSSTTIEKSDQTEGEKLAAVPSTPIVLKPTPTPTPTPTPASATVSTEVTYSPFERYLTVGSVGADVKTLQILLNQTGFPIALSGIGSKGNETTKFGPATAKALAQLQCHRGLVCEGTPETTGYGATNKDTIEILNALYNLTRPKDYSKRTIRIKK